MALSLFHALWRAVRILSPFAPQVKANREDVAALRRPAIDLAPSKRESPRQRATQ